MNAFQSRLNVGPAEISGGGVAASSRLAVMVNFNALSSGIQWL
jgi:hypothetical protein